MNLTICERMLQIAPAPLSVHPHSLYQALEQIKDGRKRRGKRYPLALIFTLLLLGKLAGETTILEVIEWVKWRQQWLKASCDAEELTRMLAAVLLKVRAEQKRDSGETETLRQVAVDGKTVRGTLSHRQEHQPAVHVVSWHEPESGLVLAHRAVEHKRHEISTLLPWLCPTLVKDRIITTDALHTQRAFCAEVIRFAGHSVLIAKKNQPTL